MGNLATCRAATLLSTSRPQQSGLHHTRPRNCSVKTASTFFVASRLTFGGHWSIEPSLLHDTSFSLGSCGATFSSFLSLVYYTHRVNFSVPEGLAWGFCSSSGYLFQVTSSKPLASGATSCRYSLSLILHLSVQISMPNGLWDIPTVMAHKHLRLNTHKTSS